MRCHPAGLHSRFRSAPARHSRRTAPRERLRRETPVQSRNRLDRGGIVPESLRRRKIKRRTTGGDWKTGQSESCGLSECSPFWRQEITRPRRNSDGAELMSNRFASNHQEPGQSPGLNWRHRYCCWPQPKEWRSPLRRCRREPTDWRAIPRHCHRSAARERRCYH